MGSRVPRPANLNQTEAAAWDWLVGVEGYDPDEIRRDSADQSPDFICPDTSYEAKRPNGHKFVVSERQRETFDTLDPVIVIIHEEDDEPRSTFRWSEREDEPWAAHAYDQSQIRMSVSGDVRREWNALLAQISEDDEEALRLIIDYFAKDASRVEEARASGRRTTRFRGPG